MAETTIVVCDVCGKPASEVVTIKTSRGNFVKDLCAQHVTEMTSGARKPRPGRPRKIGQTSTASAPRRRGRPRKTAAANGRKTRKTAGRKTTRRKPSARKTSRRKAQASTSSA
jgi:hypothetical protein